MAKFHPVKGFVLFSFFFATLTCSAQLITSTGYTATELATMLAGSGVTVSGATMNCPNLASGEFDGTLCNVGLDSGVVLTSGRVLLAEGPNNTPGAGWDNASPGDADLNSIGGGTRDACVLEFDIVPVTSSISFEYVFGSEEYLEWIGSIYNDIFAFWISGPGIPGMFNMATVPFTAIPVSINTINPATAAAYYIDNGDGATPPYAINPFYIQYDGFTTILTASHTVTACSTYHLKLAIADRKDNFYDSGVFLKANSLVGTVIADFSYTGSPYCQSDPDPSPVLAAGALSGTYSASPAGLVINASTGVIDISASSPGTYTITNTVIDPTACAPITATTTITINPSPTVSVTPAAPVICTGGSVVLTAAAAPADPPCTGYFQNATPVAIPAGPAINSVINVSGVAPSSFSPSMLNQVCLNINHTYDSDLDITLTSPCGTSIDLSSNNGGAGDNYTNTCFSPAAATSVVAGVAPFTGSYLPEGSFGSFTGCNVNGNWILTIDDVVPMDLGTLLNWSIDFDCGGSIVSYSWTPSTGLSSTTTATTTASPSSTTTYTVTVTDNNGCQASASSTVTVVAAPSASFSYAGSPYCPTASDPSPILGAGATSGTWTASPAGLVINAATGTIDVSASTPGTYTITNTVAPTASCPGATATFSITILPLQNASFSYSPTSFCTSGTDPIPTITGTAGGTFSGAGVVFISTSTGQIDLSATGSGTFTITYTTPGPCAASSSVTITITSPGTAGFSYIGSPYCQTDPDPSPVLSAGATSGTWTATPAGLVINAATGTIDLSTSLPGTYTITNTLPATGGCPAVTATFSITIDPADNPSFSYPSSTYCITGTDPIPVITGTPGGVFSGAGVVFVSTATGEIDLAATGTGAFTITYTTSGPCPASLSQNITITLAPLAGFSYGGPYCQNDIDPAPVFDPGASAGSFSASPAGLVINAASGVIDVSASLPGTYTVTNSIAASGGCAATSATASVTVNATYATAVSATVCTGDAYILPDGSSVSTAGIYTTTLTAINGCDSVITTTLNLFPVYATAIAATICTGDSYILPDGTSVSSAGSYPVTLSSVSGCDSVVTVTVSVTAAITTTQNIAICTGDSYILPDGVSVSSPGTYASVLTSASGCDSIITTNLSWIIVASSSQSVNVCTGDTFILPDGVVVSSAGTYTSTILSSTGCDSVITTMVTVYPVASVSVSASICSGDIYTLPDGFNVGLAGVYTSVLTTSHGCDSVITTDLTVNPVYDITIPVSVCTGDSYILPDGTVVSASGIYTTNLLTAAGCDSVIHTDLSVTSVINTFVSVSLCTGDGYILPDGTSVSTAGIYTTTLASASGCDSDVVTTITLLPVYAITVSASVCSGTSYILPDGSSVSVAGTYIINLVSAAGCDSVITTNLSVNPTVSSSASVSICPGDSYVLPDGTSVSSAGIYTTILLAASGCDSTITTTVSLLSSPSTTVSASICSGSSYTLPDGGSVSIAGSYVTILSTAAGCDSTITTNITVTSVITVNISASICSGSSYVLPDGTSVSAGGIYSSTFISASGCDSVINTTLTVLPVYAIAQSVDICAGGSYILPDGTSVSAAGVYVSNLVTAAGCDSIITTTVNVIPVSTSVVDAAICSGDTYNLPDGTTVSVAGTYSTTLVAASGCDSVITTNLAVNPVYAIAQSVDICTGSTYMLPDGTSVSAAGVYISDLLTAPGCDSIITTTVNVTAVITVDISASICSGTSYILPDGTSVSAGGIYSSTFISASGCDSVINTTLTILPVYAIAQSVDICAGGSYILPDGISVSAAGTYVSNLLTAAGCDSVITTTVNVIPVSTSVMNAAICSGDTYNLPDGTTVSAAGTYSTTLVAVSGCDSVITTNLAVNPVYAIAQSVDICTGSSYVLPDGTSVSAAGAYISNLLTAAGCDSIITTTVNITAVITVDISASICSGASYILPDGTSVSAAGIYTNTFTSAAGCDSVINTTLNVLPVYAIAQSVDICAVGSYILPDGISVSASGTYVSNLLTAAGCDSIITTTVNVIPVSTSVVDAAICSGDTYNLPDGTTVSVAGTYSTTLVAASGCDSVITTNLTVNPVYAIAQSVDICTGSSYILPDGTSVSIAGIYVSNLLTAAGCDSVITTTVNVISVINVAIDTTICEGTYILPDGTGVSVSGTYSNTFISAAGCDSVITTNLTILPVDTVSLSASICAGAIYNLPDGMTASTSGIYTSTITASSGCDSVVITTLNVIAAITTDISASICSGSSYVLPDGSSVSVAGIYPVTLTAASGCDSIVNTTVNIIPVSSSSLSVSVCDGSSYILPDGTSVSAAGVYNTTLTAASGCDSVITTTVNITFPVTSAVDTSFCSGDNLTLPDGAVTSIAGSFVYNFIAASGCDSTVTWNVSQNPLPIISFDLPDTVCLESAPIALDGTPAGGIYSGTGISGSSFDPNIAGTGGPYDIQYSYTDANGCSADTVVFITVEENFADAGLDTTIYVGQSAILDGNTGGNYLWTPSADLNCGDCPNPNASPIVTTTYTLTSIDDIGCIASDNVTVFVLPDPGTEVYVPNAFTPNGDGQNDYFFAYGPGLTNIKSMRIYDRWGELLYEETNIGPAEITRGWNGMYAGIFANSAVFAYILELEFIDGQTIMRKGNVTLLR